MDFDLGNPDVWRIIGLLFVITTLVVIALAEPTNGRRDG